MPVTEINRSTLREINPEIKDALKTVENKFGVSINLGRKQIIYTRFSAENYTTKLKVAVVK